MPRSAQSGAVKTPVDLKCQRHSVDESHYTLLFAGSKGNIHDTSRDDGL